MAEPEGAGEYEDRHRALLQAFVSNRCLTEPLLRQLISRVMYDKERDPDSIQQDEIDALLGLLNRRISDLDFRIAVARDQVVGTVMYVFVNTRADDTTKAASYYGPSEIQFIKACLDLTFRTNQANGAEVFGFTSAQALAASIRIPGITQTQAEKVLESLQADDWLYCSRDHFYSLSERALAELHAELVEKYGGGDEDDGDAGFLRYCSVCQTILTVGERCPESACRGRLHPYCSKVLDATARRHNRPKTCPVCSADWAGHGPVGAAALE